MNCAKRRNQRVIGDLHWVRPALVAEVKYLTWTDDNLLRQVVYEGLRADKPAAEVRRPVPHKAWLSFVARSRVLPAQFRDEDKLPLGS
jgi:ATP-dependent DNA ligase